MAGLRSIPADIYEAAEIDGANYFQRIRKITIPMMKNTIVINTILIITGGFKIFEDVYKRQYINPTVYGTRNI